MLLAAHQVPRHCILRDGVRRGRSREVEEKRQLALRQKKEAEEKAKADKAEEKRLAKEAEEKKVAAKDSKEKPTGEKGSKENETNAAKENGTSETPQQSSKNFEILRRVSEGPAANDMVADEEADEEESGQQASIPVDDKAVKPKEVVRDTAPSRRNGAWQKKEPAASTPAPTATQLEEDGWSTVSNTKQRPGRRGNQAARAIAS